MFCDKLRIGGIACALGVLVLVMPRPSQAALQVDVEQEIPSAQNPERNRAVELARDGDFDEALRILRRLHREMPSDTGVRADLAAALSWAGLDEEAFDLGADLPFAELPAIIAESVARSARNLRYPDFAAGLYRGVIGRDGGRVESQIGFTLALAEGGNVDRALQRLDTLLAFQSEDPDVTLAAGHVYMAAERWLEAALAYRRALDAGADRGQATRNEARALREAGASLLAVERMRAAPEAFPDELHADLLAGEAARWAEWASVVPERPQPQFRFDPADRALTKLDRTMAELSALDSAAAAPSLQRVRADKLVALYQRDRMAELMDEVQIIEEGGGTLRPYAQRLAADAALALGWVDESIRRYRAALAGWPDDPGTTLGLFWALVEARRFSEADQLLASFLEGQPEFFQVEGTGEAVPNPDRLPMAIARHLGWAFAGRLTDAHDGLASLHRQAPMNAELRQELASVLRWRGWPRRADVLYRRTLTVDPERTGARVGRIDAALDMDERARARAIADSLLRTTPGDERVQRAARRVDVTGSWTLSSRYEAGRSTGGERGTRDRALVTRLTSPPVGDRARLFVGSRRTDARFPEGLGVHDRLLAGVQVRSSALALELEGHIAREGELRPGAAARIELRGDHWRFGLSGDSRTTEIPLRAARAAIDGWTVGASVGRRAHEGREWIFEAGYLELQDGNRRPSVRAAIEEQFHRTHAHRLAFRVDAGGSTSSRTDAPYFNPSRFLSGTGTLLWDWTWLERRTRSYSQRLSIGGGAVAQEGFGTRAVASIALNHTWEASDRFEVSYGVSWASRAFDGIRERRVAGQVGLVWRIP
ncbi:MAG: poly-beta-1,6 N-acetyl-D-glucosamine export porin PgaA [Gemmatimonadota bacterium]|nr:poly-beta-1,6 N-acetyl-D-glucosamine export porin PgaA [Gemmatimonadota bacterium]